MKKYLLLLALCFITSISLAQRKSVTDDYHTDVIDGIPYSSMPGKVSYGYIVGEDGRNLNDGPYSIKCALTNYKYNAARAAVTLNGSYVLNTTYSKGNLNGALSFSCKLNYTATNRAGSRTEGVSSSMTGGFVNGVPNGAFNINRNGDLKSSLSCNFKNGDLVGAFSCSLLDEDGNVRKYNGSLTQTGKLTGAWKFNDTNLQFQNGVLISKSDNGVSTRPVLVELAKKYAAKTITKEELMKHNVFIKVDSVLLGDYVRTVVFRDSGVDFDKLTGWDFRKLNHIKYEYLHELLMLTDEGAKVLAEQVYNGLMKGELYETVEICTANHGEDLSFIGFNEEYGLNRIMATEATITHYFDLKYFAGSLPKDGWGYVYITPERMEIINKAIDKARTEKVAIFNDVLLEYIGSKGYDGKSKMNTAAAYIQGDKNVWNSSAESILKSRPNAKREYLLETEKRLKEVSEIFEVAYKAFKDNHTAHPTNADFLVWTFVNEQREEICRYIKKESVSEFEKILNSFSEEESKIKREMIQDVVNFILSNKTSSSIAYDEQLTQFFYHSSLEEFRLEFSKQLKELCPIVACEIVSIDDGKVVCKITKQGKKKVLVSYEISLVYNNEYKLSVESFDINNAKVVE